VLTVEQFKALIEAKRELWRRVSELRSLGVDLMEFQELNSKITNHLMEAAFNKIQLDAIYWWLYESPHGIDKDPHPEEVHMWDEVGEPIPLGTAEELYAYLLTERVENG
jgi:hypothetical protein